MTKKKVREITIMRTGRDKFAVIGKGLVIEAEEVQSLKIGESVKIQISLK